ncbi:MAG: nucleotide exchange factor GrpE, partial [Lapillicoccus sp.]
DASLAAERLSDLQRLQAEYVNYKKRVDRDRAVAREMGISQVLESLLPVLDDIHLAREHGDLEAGPFAAIAEKLEAILGRFGVERFGAVGEQFDPMVHEALMHVEADLDESATMTTVVQILQPGYRTRDRLVRPARVSVADPK